MKAHFLLLALLPFAAFGQRDSLATDSAASRTTHTFSITAGGEGVKVRVDPLDTVAAAEGDTIRIRTGGKLIRIITTRLDTDTTVSFENELARLKRKRRRLFTYWAGLELGLNTFITPDGRLGDGPQSGPLQLNNSRSRFFAINFIERKVEFGTNHIGLFTGLGVEFLNYRLSSNSTLGYNADSTYAVAMDVPQLRKNKLRQIGLRMPLMLEFNTARAKLPANRDELPGRPRWPISRKENFHLAAGVVGSWYFDTMYKQKWSSDGHNEKQRDKGDYNLLPYRLAARGQIGFGSWNFFAEYSLTPMFNKGTAPELMPLNVGLTLLGFN